MVGLAPRDPPYTVFRNKNTAAHRRTHHEENDRMTRRLLRWNCLLLTLCILGSATAYAAPDATKQVSKNKKKIDSAKTEKETAQADNRNDKADRPEKKEAKEAKDGKAETAAGTASKQTASKEAAKVESNAQPAKKDKAETPPATLKIKKEPLRIEVSLDGLFEAQHMTEIVLRPQEWSSLTVLKAVEHGAAVHRGDLLLALELDKIDHAIADAQADGQLAALALQQAEQSLRSLERTTPLDLAAGERSQQHTAEDLKFFFEQSRPMLVKSFDFNLKLAHEQVENQEEELRQLEKMYEIGRAHV
jgi:acetyl/propionyl-CoA carboxylase alpha subunit